MADGNVGDAGESLDQGRASPHWSPGRAPVAVVLISLNEGHHLPGLLDNIAGWAAEVFLVDSYSKDDTVSIALERGVHVVQRQFDNFGKQWNFALESLPIRAPWTMKLDPDERLTDELKHALLEEMSSGASVGLAFVRRLHFMGRPMPVQHKLTRVWRTGRCRFSDVSVNEHPLVDGEIREVAGTLEHHDSPDLHHWYEKQNRYSTAEALAAFSGASLSVEPRLFGSALARRMWIKKNFRRTPGRYVLLFLYNYLVKGACRAGYPGYVWARLRSDVRRFIEYKHREMQLRGPYGLTRPVGAGEPDPRVPQY